MTVLVKKGGCIPEAFKIMRDNGNIGQVYWVDNVFLKGTGGHAYYIPNETDLEARALNTEDNGFTDYCKLTVAEVLAQGRIYSLEEHMQKVREYRERR